MTFLSHLRFDIKPGSRETFLSAFRECGMLVRPKTIPGYRWGRLSEACDGSHFMVIAQWESEADYAKWQEIAFKDLDRLLIKSFLGTLVDPRQGELYETVLDSG